ncbi:MAG: lysophospholipid acyltransferase family protein [Pirellulales bacterium]|nr:lysophospholipid acyltransferase family protein [Pirellulales bacterium]
MSRETTLVNRFAGFAAATAIRSWMSTLDYRGHFFDPAVDLIHTAERSRIYVLWHEYLLLPLYLRGNTNLSMLLSKHRDADVLARVASHMGFHCVRGSTYNGATSALMELARRGRQMHIAITPDGPRGPRRTLAQGAIFLASRLQLPIVPLGFGLERPWRARSWDRFAVPRPFTRARAMVGPEIWIAPGLDRAQLELRRQQVERLLNDLTTHAEAWADNGGDVAGSIPARRQGLLLDAPGSVRRLGERLRLYAAPLDDDPGENPEESGAAEDKIAG